MEIAILMASGLGTRLRPLTDNTPKPLVKVIGKPMIETIIDGLEMRGISKLVVVTGYLGNQFDYLKEKYDNIELVRNEEYETVNNISSIYAAKDYLLQGNCFICEADLFVSDPSIFLKPLTHSCYYGKYVNGHCDDWVLELNSNGFISRIGKAGDDCYCMCGISYFTMADSEKLYSAITTEYGRRGYEKLFWDEVLNMHINEFELTVTPIHEGQIVEIDTVEDYEAFLQKQL